MASNNNNNDNNNDPTDGRNGGINKEMPNFNDQIGRTKPDPPASSSSSFSIIGPNYKDQVRQNNSKEKKRRNNNVQQHPGAVRVDPIRHIIDNDSFETGQNFDNNDINNGPNYKDQVQQQQQQPLEQSSPTTRNNTSRNYVVGLNFKNQVRQQQLEQQQQQDFSNGIMGNSNDDNNNEHDDSSNNNNITISNSSNSRIDSSPDYKDQVRNAIMEQQQQVSPIRVINNNHYNTNSFQHTLSESSDEDGNNHIVRNDNNNNNIAAVLVDSHIERERLAADLRPAIENEVLQNLRATVPAAVAIVEDKKKTKIIILVVVMMIIIAIVTGIAIPLLNRRNDNGESPITTFAPFPITTFAPSSMSPLTLSPTTLAPSPAPTPTRYTLSQVGPDITNFPSYYGCLSTSSDGTVVAGCEFFSPPRVVAANNATTNQGNDEFILIGEDTVWNITTVWALDISSDGTNLVLGFSRGVQIFRLQDNIWIPVSDMFPNDDDDDFGRALAFSKDGSVLAVGAPQIDQIRETGYVTIYNKNDNNGQYLRNGNVLFGLEELDHFGQSLALSADGTILAVGAPQDMSGQRDSVQHGYVRTYRSDFGRYISFGQTLFGAVPNDTSSSGFGAAIALSGDGRILAAGGRGNDFNTDTFNAGHVRVFNFSDTNEWVRLGNDITGMTNFAELGTSIALSSDGMVLAIGAPGGIDPTGNETGFVRLYRYESNINDWTPIGNDILGRSDSDGMGVAVALSDDGSRVVAAAEEYIRIFEIAEL